MAMTADISVFERLSSQIRDNCLLFAPGDESGLRSMIEIRGKITFAYELGLITEAEWEELLGKAFSILYGE